MTTNQTIDGVLVSRELLERVLTHDFAEDCQECGIGQSDAWKELRALLDAPINVRSYGAVGDGVTDDSAAFQAAVAAQPKVEPVTMDGKTTIREYVANSVPEDQISDDWTKGYEECKRRIHRMFQQQVNAEQPAPVALK